MTLSMLISNNSREKGCHWTGLTDQRSCESILPAKATPKMRSARCFAPGIFQSCQGRAALIRDSSPQLPSTKFQRLRLIEASLNLYDVNGSAWKGYQRVPFASLQLGLLHKRLQHEDIDISTADLHQP